MRSDERILGDVEALRLSPAGWRSASIRKGMNYGWHRRQLSPNRIACIELFGTTYCARGANDGYSCVVWIIQAFELDGPAGADAHPVLDHQFCQTLFIHCLPHFIRIKCHRGSTIAGMIGHKQQSITSRYLHLDKALISAANIVAAETLRLMQA
jgi:hypothetical protein